MLLILFFCLLHWKHITLFHYYANRKEYWVSSCRFHVWSEYGVGCSFSNMVMVKRRWKGLGKAWSWVGYGAEEDFYKQTYLRYLGLSSSKHRCRMAIKGTDVDESKIHGHWCSLLASAKGPYIWWFILLKARILFPSPLINTRHAP